MDTTANPPLDPRTVLVCDDEREIADLVASLLEREGYAAHVCYSGAEALLYCNDHDFDLAILDIMMPGMNGFELARRLREHTDAPIIFLSAKDEEVDKVLGFAVGADDYVTKPFRPREFIMRVRACLRRYARPARDARPEGTLSACGIELDPHAHTAAMLGEPLPLTPKEFELLRLLMEAAGKPVSATDLFRGAWGEPPDSSSANTVMVHVRNLRKKIAAVDPTIEVVQTVWGVGYKMAQGTQR